MTTTMIETRYDTLELDSPVGSLTLVASGAGLRAILWPRDDPGRAGLAGATLLRGPERRSRRSRSATRGVLRSRPHRLRPAARPRGDTPFQVAAWEALSAIPYGETRTYAEQAVRIGRPSAARAIGAANGRNPISIVLPCHRVVGSDGSLTRVRRRARGEGCAARVRSGVPRRSAAWLKPGDERSRTAFSLAPAHLATLPAPGHARWGGSGSLNPKSAPAGPNAVRGTVSSGLVCARGVDRSGPAHWERSNRVRSGRKQR